MPRLLGQLTQSTQPIVALRHVTTQCEEGVRLERAACFHARTRIHPTQVLGTPSQFGCSNTRGWKSLVQVLALLSARLLPHLRRLHATQPHPLWHLSAVLLRHQTSSYPFTTQCTAPMCSSKEQFTHKHTAHSLHTVPHSTYRCCRADEQRVARDRDSPPFQPPPRHAALGSCQSAADCTCA